MSDATDARLAARYEAYPYPRRDPADEARRLVIGSPSHLREVDHWVFGARRSRSQPLNALFAGGGSGDGSIMLATQMARAGRPGMVTHLDRSAAALAVAQARAKARGLDNMVFRRASLLDLPGAAREQFDYIDCCGVLHHLPDPGAGLAALLSVLAPGGGMGLMVYAPHGRTGVYMLQDALQLLAPDSEPPAARLEVARRVMRHLPQTAWLRLNRYFSDHLDGGDAGLYDLLLNPRDRAFDIPALHALLENAGLAITCMIEPLRYDPALLLPDPRLRGLAAALDPVGRAALAEALAGNMSTHVLYCARTSAALTGDVHTGEAPSPADAMAEDAVPVAREMPAAELARGIGPDGMLGFDFGGLGVQVALPPLAPAILRLIDGQRSVGAIAAAMQARGTDAATFARAWRESWAKLSGLNRILLAPPV